MADSSNAVDNRTILAVVLSLGIWYGWLALFPPEQPVVEEGADGAPVATDVVPAATPAPTPATPAPSGPIEDTPVRLCGIAGDLTSADGSLHDVTLPDWEARYDVQPLYMWIFTGMSGAWDPYGDTPGPVSLFGPHGRALAAGAGPLTMPSSYTSTRVEADGRVTSRTVTPEGVEILRTLTEVGGDPCLIEMEVTWRNTGASPFRGNLWVGIHGAVHEAADRYDTPNRAEAFVDGDVWPLDDPDEITSITPIEGQVDWIGFAGTYFGLYAVPAEGTTGTVAFTRLSERDTDEPTLGVHYTVADGLDAGASSTARFTLYAGHKDVDKLAAVHPALENAVELGFFGAFAYPLLVFLKQLHGLIGDWGLAIIALTFAIKLIFFPLTQRSFKSSQAMSAIQPEMQKIREQYKDNPEELNRRTIALMQERGVNPLGGCLPMLLQMPVWFALYSVLWSSVELYHADFGYLLDLTTPDPYMALPTIVVGLMLVQQQLMPTGNMDPAQARMMKMMPLIFGFFFFALPSGLVLYIFVNMLLSILQQWYIKRTFQGPTAPPATQGA